MSKLASGEGHSRQKLNKNRSIVRGNIIGHISALYCRYTHCNIIMIMILGQVEIEATNEGNAELQGAIIRIEKIYEMVL